MEMYLIQIDNDLCAYRSSEKGLKQIAYRGERIITSQEAVSLCERYYDQDLEKVVFYYNTLNHHLGDCWCALLKANIKVEASYFEELAKPKNWRLDEKGLHSENDDSYALENLPALLATWKNSSMGDEQSFKQMIEENHTLKDKLSELSKETNRLIQDFEETSYKFEECLSVVMTTPTRVLVYCPSDQSSSSFGGYRFRTKELVLKGVSIIMVLDDFSLFRNSIWLLEELSIASPISGYCFPLLSTDKISKFPGYPVAVMSTSAQDNINDILTWLGQSDLEYRYEP